MHSEDVEGAYLILFIERPLRRDGQEVSITEQSDQQDDTGVTGVTGSLTRRPFLLFSLICWPRLSSSSWWTCR